MESRSSLDNDIQDPEENAESSDFESFSEDGDDEPQNVITQRTVFGSDTESDNEVVADPTTSKIRADQREANSSRVNESEPDSLRETHHSPSRVRTSPDRPPEPQGSAESASEDEDVVQTKSTTSRLAHLASSSDDESEEPQANDFDRTAEGLDVRVEDEVEEDVEEEGNDEDEQPDETRIAVDFPLIRADLGREMHLVKMPNFLSVETRPFDQNYYEDELDEDEVLDEEGRTRLKLKVENTIRWRVGKSENGDPVHESNARIVRWSDGSLSLHLGDEIFDIHNVDIHSDYNYLFIREGSGLQGQSSLNTKLTFRPHSTDSFTHRKITLSLADKTNKSQKVKILPVAGADPESNRLALVRKEEEKLRASLRRESQLRRMRERQAASRSSTSSLGDRRRSRYEAEDEEDDENTTSLNALKRKAKSSLAASRKDVAAIYSSESESLSDISEPRRKVRAKISDEEQSD